VSIARSLVTSCRERGLTLGTAESVTAGLVAATIADVPGCSDVFRGGIVTYASDLKVQVLGVPADWVEHVVTARVAEAMAVGARKVLGADLVLSTTGVAGPQRLDDQPPGTVWLAVSGPGDHLVSECVHVAGDRAGIRAAAATAALELAERALRGNT
jgi:nicotinamide-nucleotide amidase